MQGLGGGNNCEFLANYIHLLWLVRFKLHFEIKPTFFSFECAIEKVVLLDIQTQKFRTASQFGFFLR